nr:HAD-IC family P-type ATPase [Bdellovibrio sp. HM001]
MTLELTLFRTGVNDYRMDLEITSAHEQKISNVITGLNSSERGLSSTEALRRLAVHGPNIFPTRPPTPFIVIFLRQFLSPLIYALLIAVLLALWMRDYADAVFIFAVLLINASIGGAQEYSAQKSAAGLRQVLAAKSLVVRDGVIHEVDAEDLVPGDLILLESGMRVPADIRLVSTHYLEIDESLLTGESLEVLKDPQVELPLRTPLVERVNMAFTGSLVARGRGRGVVVGTALRTELGKIVDSLEAEPGAKPPLLIRMERLTRKSAVFLLLATAVMAVILVLRGYTLYDVLMVSIAMAVSAIPEGLPVALTVALAVASRRMAKRNVIVRRLAAVEALGSCTYIATDKTGTLTVNQLTVKKIALPELPAFGVGGSGLKPTGEFERLEGVLGPMQQGKLRSLALAGALCNEAQLFEESGEWVGHGDSVDLAFLVLAEKTGLPESERAQHYSLVDEIPFEPENQFAATLHRGPLGNLISVKGAVEKVLPMCKGVELEHVLTQMNEMAEEGYRVLALAGLLSSVTQLKDQLQGLSFLGLVGMMDPLREEAKEAIDHCRSAGITVSMVTGDHPRTALAIAKQLGLAGQLEAVVSGPQLKAAGEAHRDQLISRGRVYARVEPQQKLEIVQSLLAAGHFVAVTGDGANDAPALRAANVGVAMGKSGTDVAKDVADLVITDDRFATIVAGIEEGRIAYSNIRKVVYLLISTGVAEILMFFLSLILGVPLPLTAIQILWLNLVTNGIQDVTLAMEPGEGDELHRPPRRPEEPIFDRLMLERVVLSSVVMGRISFSFFYSQLREGVSLEVARNLTLLLMVLFENVMIGNCRSETKSAFSMSPLKNPYLLAGTLGAQLLHIGAMYIPFFQTTLGVAPVHLSDWIRLLGLALSVLLVMETYKLARHSPWLSRFTTSIRRHL